MNIKNLLSYQQMTSSIESADIKDHFGVVLKARKVGDNK